MADVRNIGWSLGNACPFDCNHCYSASMRVSDSELTREDVKRIVDGLCTLGVRGVTLGGNEPIYTNGPSINASLLPLIIHTLRDAGIRPSMVTSGPSAGLLASVDVGAFDALDMVFVSLDAPTEERHNANRGARLFRHAVKALRLASERGVDSSILYCATRQNFGLADVDAIVALSHALQTRLRINTLKPTGRAIDAKTLTGQEYVAGFQRVIENCVTDLVDEPALRMLLGLRTVGCPCGSSTFRISHPRPDGQVPIAPCMYVAASRYGDIRVDSLVALVEDDRFEAIRRCYGPPGSGGTREGCHAQALLAGADEDPMITELRGRTLRVSAEIREDECLRQRYGGYLCTWMGRPR